MIDLSFLTSYAVPVVIGICLCIGYVVKTSLTFIKNKYIPLIMAIVGILLSIWINRSIDPNIILSGMFSGLASTGLYEMFRNIINNKEKKKEIGTFTKENGLIVVC